MDQLVTDTHLEATVAGLTSRHFQPHVVESGAEALVLIQTLIPAGASVMNGASRTLDQIGLTALLKSGAHPWKNLHADILAEAEKDKQAALRRAAVNSDAYLGSVHALTEQGEMIIASNTGSQLPHLAFTSRTVVLVVSVKKIVADLTAAFDRLHTVVMPLEDARIQAAYGVHTVHAKTLILHRENPSQKRDVHVVLVKEDVGF